ncbi:MAG: ATP-binding protein [Actinomycetota bacterium]
MTRPRFAMEMQRAIPFAVAVAAMTLGLVDLFAATVLGVSHLSVPRLVVAFGISLWAYRESRSRVPAALPLLVVVGLITAAGSVASEVVELPFAWYDEYTTYSVLLAAAIASSAARNDSRWVAWAWPLGVTSWAFTYSLVTGREVGAAVDWMIVAGATVAILHYLVGTMVRSANSALETQTALSDLHRALARCSNALLQDASDSAMDDALDALLEATDADYACVDVTVYDDDPPSFAIVAEATARPLPPGANWQGGSYRSLPTVLAAHLAGQVCDIRAEDLDGEERRLYAEDGIQSELSVPIFVDGQWRGSMVLASFTRPREWSPLEVEILVQAASLVGAYWRRRDDNQRLEQLLLSKDELIASVSHELRTPLTGVVGLAEELAVSAREMDPVTLEELAGLVADQSRELAYLVEDLLVAARMEMGALTIRMTEVSLLEEARAVVASVMGERVVRVEGEDGPIRADPLRCRQILRNLLTNAIRYGGQDVAVTLEEEGEWVLLTVSDDGEGVPVGDEERIFQPYVRSRRVAPGSIGVGLAVSRNLARLMGGSLEYQRTDGLTRFQLRLPKAHAATREEIRATAALSG